MPLTILYQDSNLVAISKPAGIFTHRPSWGTTNEEFVLQLLRDQLNQFVYPIHRLDRATSGVLLFALDSETATMLCDQFRQRTTTKIYHALIRGFHPPFTTYDTPLLERCNENQANKTAFCSRTATSAITHVQCMEQWQYDVPSPCGRYPTVRVSLVEITPETGRWHQIRRHLKHAAFPILGDTKHGDHRYNHWLQKTFSVARILLSAESLKLYHPKQQTWLTIRERCDSPFRRTVDPLRAASRDHSYSKK